MFYTLFFCYFEVQVSLIIKINECDILTVSFAPEIINCSTYIYFYYFRLILFPTGTRMNSLQEKVCRDEIKK